MGNNLALYDQASWWDPANGFYLLNKMNPGRFQFFDLHIDDWTGRQVLDVGCGGGFTCEFLARRQAHVTGIDASAASIAQAHLHSESQGLKINYLMGDATNLPFDSQTFDVVTCVDVLEHIENWPQCIQEIHRVLRPGGCFFFDTINRNIVSKMFFVTVTERLTGLVPRGTHAAHLFIKPRELELVFKNTGFSDTRMTGLHLLWSLRKRDFFAKAGGPKILMYIGFTKKRSNEC